MREYELYVPLHQNDGAEIEPAKLKRLRQVLIDYFGGLTHFPQENEGFWKVGSFTFRDQIVILRVLSDDPLSESYLRMLKEDLKRDWKQEDFLIIAREVRVV
ncbi:MAG: hypothetical protein QOF48_2651 [Verrucomicrobiota bacterium]|jgi:hypothetical protein